MNLNIFNWPTGQFINTDNIFYVNSGSEAIDNANKLDDGQIVVTQLAKGKFKSRVES